LAPLAQTRAASVASRAPRIGAATVRAKLFDRKPDKAQTEVLRIKLVDANPSIKIDGMDRLAGKSNYFSGNNPKNWHSNIPTYAQVKYRNVYPGIDLVYHGASQRQLEYDFVLAPGADPKAIGLRFEGATRLAFNRDGDLIVHLPDGGEVIHHAPLVYQERDGKRTRVDGKCLLRNTNTITFDLASYDRSRTVYIDPGLSYSTYLGGNEFDEGYAIALDSSGDAYVTGITESTNFPTTPGAFKTTPPGGGNMFVTKLKSDGSGLAYSTYLGGDNLDNFEGGYGIAVDSSENAYVTGDAGDGDFPTTPGAFQTHPSGGYTDAFVTKLSPDGSALVYSTLLGGTYAPAPGATAASAIAIDSSGYAYVTGKTTSGNFPTTPGAFQVQNNSNTSSNAFVTKLNTTGTALVYSTYLGGSGSPYGSDGGTGITVDSAGHSYVTGVAYSNDFPTTGGAFRTANSGFSDAFVTELKTDGSGLVYSTYLGGSQPDSATGIAIDSSGSAYVTGDTQSSDFPTTAGAFQRTLKTIYGNVFVTKLKANGSGLVYSTYLGGVGDTDDDVIDYPGGDYANGITVDSFGNAYVTGWTFSTNFFCSGPARPDTCCSGAGTGTCSFPTTADAFQPTNHGSNLENPISNAFVTKVNADGSGLVYSTYLGGSMANFNDYGVGIAIDSAGDAYVTGLASSTDFPTTKGAFQTTGGSDSDAFVTKLIVPAGPTPTPTPSPSPTPKPTPSPSPTPAPTATPSPSPTPKPTPSPTPKPTPTATPTPTPPPPGTLSGLPPLGLGFGSVGTNATPKNKTFTIKNSSKKGTLIGTVGTLSAPYTVEAGEGSFTLPPGGKLPVTVEFAPIAANLGKDPATLGISSNDPKHPSENVKLTGIGVAGKLSIPARVTFMPTKVGASASKIITLKNTGLGVLHWQLGAFAAPFNVALVASGSGLILDHLQSQKLMIQFAPTTKGTVVGTLNITSDDPNHLSVNVTLKGTGK